METQTETKPNKLERAIDNSGLEIETADKLKNTFVEFFNSANKWKQTAEGILVSDADQIEDMNLARETRLELRDIRIRCDKKRKVLKADSLQYGKAVQSAYNMIEGIIAPLEKHLQDQEDFAKIQGEKQLDGFERARKAHIDLERFSEFIPAGVDLRNMTDENWLKLCDNAQILKDAAAQKEKERIEKETADKLERVRLEEENAKLQKQKRATDNKVRKEREAAEVKLAEEKAKADKLQAEIDAKKEAEEKATREAVEKAEAELRVKEEAEAKAEAEPDKEKLLKLAFDFEDYKFPEISSDLGKEILDDCRARITGVINSIRLNVEKHLK